MMGYVTLAELKASQELHGTTYADHDLELAIAAASEAIDRRCGRTFGKDASASARFYTPLTAASIAIDDAVSVSELATDDDGDGVYETVWPSTSYRPWPWNAQVEGRPITRLTRLPSETKPWPWWIPSGARVTAVWGWPAVPEAIRQAAMLLAARLVKRSREAPFGVAAFGLEVGSATRIAAVDPDVRMLTDPLVRLGGAVY